MHVAPAAPVVSLREAFPALSQAPRRHGAGRIEQRAGRLLRMLRDHDLLGRLGFVRLGDYVVDRLGVSYRTAQEWMRVDEALESAPLLAEALSAGEVSSAHVRLLTRVVTLENEAGWVELARSIGVRELGRAVTAWREEQEASGGGAGRLEGAGGGGTQEGLCGVPRDEAADRGRRLAEDVVDDPPESERIELEAPAWLAHMWRDTIAFARQLAGAPVSRGACLEMVLAEFGGSAEAAPADGNAPADPGPGGRAFQTGQPERLGVDGLSPSACPATGGRGSDGPSQQEDPGNGNLPRSAHQSVTEERDPPVRQPQGELEEADPRSFASADGSGDTNLPLSAWPTVRGRDDLSPSAPGTSDSTQKRGSPRPRDVEAADLDAHAIDCELLDLMALRQRHDWSVAERLRAVAASRTFQLDGFTSLEAYARERLALPARRVYLLLALHRKLERLPGVRASFLAGRLTLKKAMIVGSVASVVTELAWIGRARSVTLRRLEDEVCFWKHLKEVRPSVWELLDGGPLPQGIVLVPGRPARLSSSAPEAGSVENDLRSSAPTESPGDSRLSPSAHGESSGDARLHSSARSTATDCDDLPPSALPRAVLSARAFIHALEEAEGAVPLPAHMVMIRIRVEPGVREMWESVRARCRETVGESLAGWEVLALALDAFWKTWDNNLTRRQRREHPTIERDGWRCVVPGCRSMGTGKLHEHHIVFRSHGGALTDPGNLVTLCTAHHERLLHEGFIRCSGRAPDDLTWELGVERGREPFLVYRGEKRVGGCAA